MRPTPPDHPEWLHQVRVGAFEAIPDPLSWEDSCQLAHFINGYAVSEAKGWGLLRRWANDRIRQAARTGEWSGIALELWCCLFYEHRRYRHFGEEPTGPDLELLNLLCATLRQELVALCPRERQALVSLFEPQEPPP
jgi:hypothetical protein